MTSPVGLTLLLPDKPDPERDAIGDVWERLGGRVLRISRFWEPPALDPREVRVYGTDSFCLVLQQKLGFELVTLPDDLLVAVSPDHLRRSLWRRTIGELGTFTYPTFCKSATPKLFPARVYANAAEHAAETNGLDAKTAVVVSEPVNFAAEAGCFVLDRIVLDCAGRGGGPERMPGGTRLAGPFGVRVGCHQNLADAFER